MRQPGKKQQSSSAPRGGRSVKSDNVAKFAITEAGTLLPTAMALLTDMSPTKVKSMLRHHQLAVNGTPSSQFNRPVQPGDELEVNFDRSFRVFKHPKLSIVYEDDDVMVVDKGYGMLSTSAGSAPARGPQDETVFSLLRNYVKGYNEHARIYVVHRLDRDTSGLMLLVRTAAARDKMLKQWSTMVLDRRYIAVVEGALKPDSGMIQNYLYDDENGYMVLSSDDPDCGGRIAKTRFTVLDRSPRYSLVELTLRTGHKNQLRVHMAGLGHPISGDRKYGARPNATHRLALHATKLSFIHPVTGRTMTFESPVPAPFTTLLSNQ